MVWNTFVESIVGSFEVALEFVVPVGMEFENSGLQDIGSLVQLNQLGSMIVLASVERNEQAGWVGKFRLENNSSVQVRIREIDVKYSMPPSTEIEIYFS